jgi:hypothetical protein
MNFFQSKEELAAWCKTQPTHLAALIGSDEDDNRCSLTERQRVLTILAKNLPRFGFAKEVASLSVENCPTMRNLVALLGEWGGKLEGAPIDAASIAATTSKPSAAAIVNVESEAKQAVLSADEIDKPNTTGIDGSAAGLKRRPGAKGVDAEERYVRIEDLYLHEMGKKQMELADFRKKKKCAELWINKRWKYKCGTEGWWSCLSERRQEHLIRMRDVLLEKWSAD